MMASNSDTGRLLSLGNILQYFPEFLIHVLPFIADRTVFNSIASCHRDTNKKSKSIPPPWPIDYQLPASYKYSIAVWSPDGTRVAYTGRHEHVIIIVDQRHGIIHRIENNHDADFWKLKFSSDGRFLVSADDDGIVKLWDNNVTGNYEQLQEWNMREVVGEDMLRIAISACSKYVVMSAHSPDRVVLIGVANGETVKSLRHRPVMKYITEVMFSVDCNAIFICGECENSTVIKLWRPYQDDTDEDNLITLWEQKSPNYWCPKTIVSHDKMMIAMQDTNELNRGWLLSIDNNYSCTVQKLNFVGNDATLLLQFTPDDEYIIYETKNGLKYWSVDERKFTDKEYLFYNERTMNNLCVVNCSPNNRQFIVYDEIEEGDSSLYMKSIS